MKKIHDISLTLEPNLVVWPNSIGFSTSWASQMAAGGEANVTVVHTGAHVGTHVDAPRHFVDGAPTVESLDLHALVGEASVIDFRGQPQITAAMLASLPPASLRPRLLFKTDNSQLWNQPGHGFRRDFCALTLDAAEWVVAQGIRLVGIDYLSIQRFHDGFETHKVLLRPGTVILEGLDLRAVDPGIYELCCLPLKIAGADGAPARAVLIER
ncbi:MAG: cyclase family protein [Bernardetiaceae bacterium]|jgi:arylformamidase|nr:cyclase family protein [Bernardetiaceae bacterium]